MTKGRLDLTRQQVLTYRRRVGALDDRLPPGPASLRRAAWAGLQDSMPRAALLSIHARVEATEPTTWEDPSLVQLWGPRFSAYVVAEHDIGVFTLGRLSDDPRKRQIADDLAARLRELLDGKRMSYAEAGRALGENPNQLRYAAPTGTVLIRWEGARRPLIWTIPVPEVDPFEARLELARRYLHVFGPGTAGSFATWAGIHPTRAIAAFDALMSSLTPVQTPIGEGWILADDETHMCAVPGPAAPSRLLPSGDAYYLLQGDDRQLLVEDAGHRSELWTSRVWPGALLVEGEIVGTWRRSKGKVSIAPWSHLTPLVRDAVEAEAGSMPLPDITTPISVIWEV